MSTSPTPSERERSDAEAKTREKEEQAKLPYKWTQTIKDLDIAVPVSGNLRGKDFEVVMTKTKLKVAIKGQEPFIDVHLLFLYFWYRQGLTIAREILHTQSKSTSPPGRWNQ